MGAIASPIIAAAIARSITNGGAESAPQQLMVVRQNAEELGHAV